MAEGRGAIKLPTVLKLSCPLPTHTHTYSKNFSVQNILELKFKNNADSCGGIRHFFDMEFILLFRIYKLDGTKYAIFLILFFLQLFHFSYY
jgi:hypothetical protein